MATARASRKKTDDRAVLRSGQRQRVLALLRERDWVGIGIELAVVTVGILLAFQIDQWGQDRRQAREERQFLERMWRETKDAIAENDWAMDVHARNRRS